MKKRDVPKSEGDEWLLNHLTGLSNKKRKLYKLPILVQLKLQTDLMWWSMKSEHDALRAIHPAGLAQ